MSIPTRLPGRALLVWTLAGSAGFAVALFWAYFRFHSQLAFAQAADSLLDVATAGLLLYTLTVAARPEDPQHPFGHGRAEPIGGLVVAVLAGVMAVEIVQSAASHWLSGSAVELDGRILWFFVLKAAFKTCVISAAGLSSTRKTSPAIQALVVDAQNDILASLLATVGIVAARLGSPRIDTLLALPMAGWILLSGAKLGLENVRLLMGEAPSLSRQEELVSVAQAELGVERVSSLKAHFLGTRLQVTVQVVVRPDLTLKQAHDLCERVRLRLEQEPDVSQAFVRIDIQ